MGRGARAGRRKRRKPHLDVHIVLAVVQAEVALCLVDCRGREWNVRRKDATATDGRKTKVGNAQISCVLWTLGQSDAATQPDEELTVEGVLDDAEGTQSTEDTAVVVGGVPNVTSDEGGGDSRAVQGRSRDEDR